MNVSHIINAQAVTRSFAQVDETNTPYILKQSLIGSRQGLNRGPFDLSRPL